MALMVVMAVVVTTIVIIVIIIIIMCIYVFIYLQIQRLITQLPGHHKDKKEQANWTANKENGVNRLTERELASLV
jgi:predicted PurR-regulated permease PerM